MKKPIDKFFTTSLAIGISLLIASTTNASSSAHSTLEFQQVLLMARRNAESLKIADLEIAAARQRLRTSKLARFPNLELGANFNITDSPTQAFMSVLNQRAFSFDNDFNNPDATDNLRLSAKASLPLFTAGEIGNSKQIATIDARGQEQILRWHKILLEQECARYYAEYLQKRNEAQIAHSLKRSLQKRREELQALIEQDKALKSDLLTVEQQISEIDFKSQMSELESNLASENLRFLLSPEFEDKSLKLSEKLSLPTIPTDELERAIATHPLFSRARDELEKATLALKIAKSKKYPRVSAYAGLENHRDLIDSDASASAWGAGVAATWNIFDRGAIENQIKLSKIALLKARENENKTKKSLLLEAQTARTRLAIAKKSANLAAQTLAREREDLRLVREKFSQNKILPSAKLRAESNFLAAELSKKNADLAKFLAICRLRAAHALYLYE